MACCETSGTPSRMTAASPTGAKVRVLVATRDPAVAHSLLELLRASGMEVHWGEPERIQAADPQLDLTDVLLVEAPSYGDAEQALVEEVRARSPMAETVFLAADATAESAVEAYRTGVYAVLPSPVGRQELLEALGAASRRKHRAEERIQELGRGRG